MLWKILLERKWVWIPAAILLVLNVLAFVGYRYLFAEQFSLEALRRDRLEKEWDAASATNAGLKRTLAAWQGATDGIAVFYDRLGTRPDKLTPMIQEIEGLARKAGVLPHQLTFAYNDHPTGELEEVRLVFPFESDYSGVRNLLHLLEVAPSFVITESVSLGTSGELQDRIRLQFGLKTYFRMEARP
jgi:hypothetical protein